MAKRRPNPAKAARPKKSPSRIAQAWANASDTQIAVALSAATFLLHFVILLDYRSSPLYEGLVWDARSYYDWAARIAGGQLSHGSVFHQAPLYSYLLAIVVRIFGSAAWPIYLIQTALGSTVTGMLYVMARKVLPRRYALLAGVACALYGSLAFYNLKVLPTSTAVFLHVLFVFVITSMGGSRRWLLGGLIAGILATCRSPALLLAPVGVLYAFVGQRPVVARHAARNALLYLVVFFVPVLAVTFHNYTAGNDFVLVSSNGGENFFIGNNPRSEGLYTATPGISRDLKF